MKEKDHKTAGLASLIVLAMSQTYPALAVEIDSVCHTDEQTLRSIQANSDQTLWDFMQAVCRGEFVLVKGSQTNSKQLLGVASSTPSTPSINYEKFLVYEVGDRASEERIGDVKNRQVFSDNVSNKKAFFDQENLKQFKSTSAEGAASDALIESTSANEFVPKEDIMGSSTSLVASLPDKPPTPENTQTSPAAVPEENLKPLRYSTNEEEGSSNQSSNYPWLYSLIDDERGLATESPLPAPITYQPSRFSRHNVDYFVDSTASNRGAELIQKPKIMSVVPYGFYVGTSFFQEQAAPWGENRSSGALPSLILGYADENAVREYQSYPGLGSRFELRTQRLKDDQDHTKWSRYSAKGEVYIPVGGGGFAGIGGSYQLDKGIVVPGSPECDGPAGTFIPCSSSKFDSRYEALYIPIGIGFVNLYGHSGKVQLNTLLGARSVSKLSQLTSASFSNAEVKYRFGDGYGLTFAYSWNANTEMFIDYWKIEKSVPFTYTQNGAEIKDRSPRMWALETGVRLHW